MLISVKKQYISIIAPNICFVPFGKEAILFCCSLMNMPRNGCPVMPLCSDASSEGEDEEQLCHGASY